MCRRADPWLPVLTLDIQRFEQISNSHFSLTLDLDWLVYKIRTVFACRFYSILLLRSENVIVPSAVCDPERCFTAAGSGEELTE